MNSKGLAILAALIIAQFVPSARAAGGEEARKFFDGYAKAYNAKDGDAIGGLFADNATYVDLAVGEPVEGKTVLLAGLRERFTELPGERISVAVRAARAVGDSAALVDARVTLTSAAGTLEISEITAVLVKSGGKWMIDSVREYSAPDPVTPQDGLADLAWLVGRWRDDIEGAEVLSDVRWSEGGAYLIRSFLISSAGDKRGTQLIAWDPASGMIRSWTFDSDGSFGQEEWTRTATGWRIAIDRTEATGERSSGTQVVTQVDKDTFTVRSFGGSIGGELVPAVPAVTIRRTK